MTRSHGLPGGFADDGLAESLEKIFQMGHALSERANFLTRLLAECGEFLARLLAAPPMKSMSCFRPPLD